MLWWWVIDIIEFSSGWSEAYPLFFIVNMGYYLKKQYAKGNTIDECVWKENLSGTHFYDIRGVSQKIYELYCN